MLGLLLPPGQTGFVFGEQLSYLRGLGGRLGYCARGLAVYDSRRDCLVFHLLFWFFQVSKPPLNYIL